MGCRKLGDGRAYLDGSVDYCDNNDHDCNYYGVTDCNDDDGGDCDDGGDDDGGNDGGDDI